MHVKYTCKTNRERVKVKTEREEHFDSNQNHLNKFDVIMFTNIYVIMSKRLDVYVCMSTWCVWLNQQKMFVITYPLSSGFLFERYSFFLRSFHKILSSTLSERNSWWSNKRTKFANCVFVLSFIVSHGKLRRIFSQNL